MKHTTVLIFALITLTGLGYAGSRIAAAIMFDRDVGGHLKLAADANTMELAETQLSLALYGLDGRGVCPDFADPISACFTSVIYRTPDEDVGYWMTNISAAHDELVQLQTFGGVSPLVESNQLLKVRETLLDHGPNGDSVTAPNGISVYPYNVGFAVWGWASLLALLGSCLLVFRTWWSS